MLPIYSEYNTTVRYSSHNSMKEYSFIHDRQSTTCIFIFDLEFELFTAILKVFYWFTYWNKNDIVSFVVQFLISFIDIPNTCTLRYMFNLHYGCGWPQLEMRNVALNFYCMIENKCIVKNSETNILILKATKPWYISQKSSPDKALWIFWHLILSFNLKVLEDLWQSFRVFIFIH